MSLRQANVKTHRAGTLHCGASTLIRLRAHRGNMSTAPRIFAATASAALVAATGAGAAVLALDMAQQSNQVAQDAAATTELKTPQDDRTTVYRAPQNDDDVAAHHIPAAVDTSRPEHGIQIETIDQDSRQHIEVFMITSEIRTWKTRLILSARATPNVRTQNALDRLLHTEVQQLDQLASRFRADSELTRINQRAGEWVEVSWAFVTVLSASLRAAQQTGGLVDPTMGRAIKAAGYDQWAGQPTETAAASHRGRWRGVGIRPGRWQAQVLTPAGTALDLGSIAKAWLADRLATTVHRSGLDVCANMGGDIRVISSEPWTVWADAGVPGLEDRPVELLDGALATSGIGKRAWKDGHHIIDPRTGLAAQTPWTSVSAVAATAVEANAASTASVILGDDGPQWLHERGLDGFFAAPGNAQTVGRWHSEVAA